MERSTSGSCRAEQGAAAAAPGSRSAARKRSQVISDAPSAAPRMPSLASSSCGPSNASVAISRRDGEADARERSAARDGRPAHRRSQRPRLRRAASQDAPTTPTGLPSDVAEEDPERDRRGGRSARGSAVDRDSRIGERKQRHDHVARPWVVELLQPLVGGVAAASWMRAARASSAWAARGTPGTARSHARARTARPDRRTTRRPIARPTTMGSTPDLSSATQVAVPSTK